MMPFICIRRNKHLPITTIARIATMPPNISIIYQLSKLIEKLNEKEREKRETRNIGNLYLEIICIVSFFLKIFSRDHQNNFVVYLKIFPPEFSF